MSQDTAASSAITDHPFMPKDEKEWWKTCCICGLAEAAHAQTTMDHKGNSVHPDTPIYVHPEEVRDPEGNLFPPARVDALTGEPVEPYEDPGDESGRLYAQSAPQMPIVVTLTVDPPDRQDGVGDVGRPPSHYATESGLDPFQVIDAFGLDYFEGNALKYLLRWRKKGGIADLRKAQHYIEELIQRSSSENRVDTADSEPDASA